MSCGVGDWQGRQVVQNSKLGLARSHTDKATGSVFLTPPLSISDDPFSVSPQFTFISHGCAFSSLDLLGKSFDFSAPLFLRVWNRDTNSADLIGLSWEINEDTQST